MMRLLHEGWPVAAVVLLTLTLVLQIPRRALFPVTVADREPECFAAFVEYDADAYDALLQKVRMSWQIKAQTVPSADDSRTGAFDFVDPLPPPRLLAMPDDGFSGSARISTPFAPAADALLPPSGARSGTEGLSPAPEPRAAELLELPDALTHGTPSISVEK